MRRGRVDRAALPPRTSSPSASRWTREAQGSSRYPHLLCVWRSCAALTGAPVFADQFDGGSGLTRRPAGTPWCLRPWPWRSRARPRGLVRRAATARSRGCWSGSGRTSCSAPTAAPGGQVRTLVERSAPRTGPRPSTSTSGSPTGQVASRWSRHRRRILLMQMHDYERGASAAGRLPLCPPVIAPGRDPGRGGEAPARADNLFRYPGLKEDYYLADFSRTRRRGPRRAGPRPGGSIVVVARRRDLRVPRDNPLYEAGASRRRVPTGHGRDPAHHAERQRAAGGPPSWCRRRPGDRRPEPDPLPTSWSARAGR